MDITLRKPEYLILKIPTDLYQNWIEIVNNLLIGQPDAHRAQRVVLKLLKNWILSRYPLHKLCAFEEISHAQARALKTEQGFYIKLREMTREEIMLSQSIRNGSFVQKPGQPDQDPQWILELDSIPELRQLSSGKEIPAA